MIPGSLGPSYCPGCEPEPIASPGQEDAPARQVRCAAHPVESLDGELDAHAEQVAEQLAARAPDLDWAEQNRRICALLHRAHA